MNDTIRRAHDSNATSQPTLDQCTSEVQRGPERLARADMIHVNSASTIRHGHSPLQSSWLSCFDTAIVVVALVDDTEYIGKEVKTNKDNFRERQKQWSGGVNDRPASSECPYPYSKSSKYVDIIS